MLYELIEQLKGSYSWLNSFSYFTTRSMMAFIFALVITLAIGKPIIKALHKLKFGQSIRTDGPQTHLAKQGTPTMGGIMIIISVTVTCLLWNDLSNPYIWILLGVFISFGVVGFIDDYLKIKRRNSDGLSAKQKYLALSVTALVAIFIIYYNWQDTNATRLVIPFFKDFTPQLGVFFIILSYFTIVGSSNAVNITDGLDGLAIVPTIFTAIGMGVIAYLTGSQIYASHLYLLYIPNSIEIIVLCAALAGAGVGFFWFNSYPAQVFMGDVGSLALGGLLGTIAVLLRQELLLIIMGAVFVAETLSTMIQVSYFRYTRKKYGEGRRFFKMAPLHHHFELAGMPETKVIARFWVVSLISVLVALLTLKLR